MISEPSNFSFLAQAAPQLVRLGALAEWSLHIDPPTTIAKIRQFAEVLAQQVAARQGALSIPGESQADLLVRLHRSRLLPDKAADVFHHLRRVGNAAVHHDKGSAAQALSCLKLARELGIWFRRTFDPDPTFSPGPFVPPVAPRDVSAGLAVEINSLRARLAESETTATRASREAEEARRAGETALERAARETEERIAWEELASEAEAARTRVEAELRALQMAHANQPPAERAEIATAAVHAADRIVVDEADTRVLIDAQLAAAGWEADSQRLRYSLGARPARARSMAISEWPTASGPVDYALFVDGHCVGVIEAKRAATAVPAALEQAKRYARTIRLDPDQRGLGMPVTYGVGDVFEVPFVFATNGRPYVRQLETQSGIWAWDARLETNRPVALTDWFTPRDLTELTGDQLDHAAGRIGPQS